MKFSIIISLLISSCLAFGQSNYKYNYGNSRVVYTLAPVESKVTYQIKRLADTIKTVILDTVAPITSKWKDKTLPDVWGTTNWKESYWETTGAYTRDIRLINDSIIDINLILTMYGDTVDHQRIVKSDYGSGTHYVTMRGTNETPTIYENNGSFLLGTGSDAIISIVQSSYNVATSRCYIRFNKKITTSSPIRILYNLKMYRNYAKTITLDYPAGFYCFMVKYTNGTVTKSTFYISPSNHLNIKKEL